MAHEQDQIRQSRIAVTGAWGNLGTKLLQHLAAIGCPHLIGIDAREAPAGMLESLRTLASGQGHADPTIESVSGDLTAWHDQRWRDALARADRVVHFAAQNPFPEATWDDATASIDMNLHLGEAAIEAELSRLVFASSNHVMGRYRTAGLGPGALTPELTPGVGTVWQAGEQEMDSTVYAVAKLTGERIYTDLAVRSQGRLSCVNVRIGWCQPGENLPTTLNAAGTPTQATVATEDAEATGTANWFRGMWLSNRDFHQLFERALLASAADWPSAAITINGVSGNRGSVWSLTQAERLLGYEPEDDVEAAASSPSDTGG